MSPETVTPLSPPPPTLIARMPAAFWPPVESAPEALADTVPPAPAAPPAPPTETSALAPAFPVNEPVRCDDPPPPPTLIVVIAAKECSWVRTPTPARLSNLSSGNSLLA